MTDQPPRNSDTPDGSEVEPSARDDAASAAETPAADAGAPADTAADGDTARDEINGKAAASGGARATEKVAPNGGVGRRLVDALTTANSGTVTVLALFLAMLVGAVIIIFSDERVTAAMQYFFSRPYDTFYWAWEAVAGAYSALFKGSIVDFETVTAAMNGEVPWYRAFYPISETLTNAAPLIFTGLAVTLAFRAGLINIGGEGQAILGACAAGLAGFLLHLPPVIHLLVALLAGALCGALYGTVPGWLKAKTGAHEVITTIMLNYVALNFLQWLVLQEGVQRPGRQDAISKLVDANAMLPRLAGDVLRVNFGIVLAILAAVGVAWLLQRSTTGFEMRAVGSNPDAARTAGMNVSRTYILAMTLAGGLAGLGGASMLLGPAAALTPSVVSGIGFDGITVALLGRGRPLGTVLAGLLFGALKAGAVRMQGEADIPVDMVTILQALIVLFIAAPALVKAVFRLREQRTAGFGPTLAKGW